MESHCFASPKPGEIETGQNQIVYCETSNLTTYLSIMRHDFHSFFSWVDEKFLLPNCFVFVDVACYYHFEGKLNSGITTKLTCHYGAQRNSDQVQRLFSPCILILYPITTFQFAQAVYFEHQ